jgi:acyl-CoA synthetase (AMP-forming)/AMP-acid ligase II
VVRVDDGRGGEVVVAVVVPAGSGLTEAEVLAFGRRHLAAHQVPGSVTFVDRLPRNSVGKLIRSDLRAIASAWTAPA